MSIAEKVCAVEVCNKPVASRGWCYGHYRRWLKYGDVGFTKKATFDVKKICCVANCDSKVRAKGVCQTHYSRLITKGSSLASVGSYTRHGLTGTPTHSTYRGMLDRCNNPNNTAYKYYGGRGVSVCSDWIGNDGLLRFIQDMGERPEGKTLDRIDPNGDYNPENCMWATSEEQALNKTKTPTLTIDGVTKKLYQWCAEKEFPYRLARERLKDGCPTEQIFYQGSRATKINNADIQQMSTLRHKGMRCKDISALYKVTENYVCKITRKYERSEKCK